MADVVVRGVRLHYEERGKGEAIVFAHGLLMSTRMWDAQLAALSGSYRCIAYDHRGQGQSEVTARGYDMDALAEDAAVLIQEFHAAPCHFVGLSMGGFVGMRLALRHPELVRSLVLLETSADPEAPDAVRRYRLMAIVARLLGTRLLVARVMAILFGKTFMTDPGRSAERAEWAARIACVDRKGAVRATFGVIDRAGVTSEIDLIKMPVLVIVGDEDVATPPFRAESIVERIAGSRLVRIPRAGHSSPVEEPAAVTDAIAAFLRGIGT